MMKLTFLCDVMMMILKGDSQISKVAVGTRNPHYLYCLQETDVTVWKIEEFVQQTTLGRRRGPRRLRSNLDKLIAKLNEVIISSGNFSRFNLWKYFSPRRMRPGTWKWWGVVGRTQDTTGRGSIFFESFFSFNKPFHLYFMIYHAGLMLCQ